MSMERVDTSARYSYDELVGLLGVPVSTEQVGHFPGGGETTLLVFGCSCRGVPIAGGFHIGTPCKQHRGPEPIVRISDRRCGVTALDGLDMEATGVLAMLVGMQEGAQRDERGCVDLAFDPDIVKDYPSGVRQLFGARLLRLEPDGRYRLSFFTCFDAATEEWY
jgi:hypothetical protein